MVERRIRMAKFPAWTASTAPSLNKMMVLELARCEYIERRESHRTGNSGTGPYRPALLAAQVTVGFITAAALVHELIEARDAPELRFQKLSKIQAADHR